MFCAVADKTLPRAKSVIDMSMIGFRPKISARRPDKGRIAVLERAYAEPTHVKSSPPLRSLVTVGRIVATAVRSRAPRRTDMIMARKDSQNEAPLRIFGGLGTAVASSAVASSNGGLLERVRSMAKILCLKLTAWETLYKPAS